MLRKRDGVYYHFDRAGQPHIEMDNSGKPCRPMLFLDGFPAPQVPSVPGAEPINWLMHPDEIGGVEIYKTIAYIPPKLSVWIDSMQKRCGIIVFWTKAALGMSSTP